MTDSDFSFDSLPELLVILDLDETLIHATERPLSRPAEFTVGPYSVYQRPWLSEFLLACAGRFRLAVWSSASRLYVEGVVNTITPSGLHWEFVWAGDRCTAHYDPELQDYISLKPLKKVVRQGFKLNRTVIVDDSPEKLVRNYGNAIYISPWTGDLDDGELQTLSRYLPTLQNEPDVRTVEKRGWRFLAEADESAQ